jgi:superfamily II DNA or RNA helicase
MNLPILRKWQIEAYNKWVANKCLGVIKSATGTGKSIVAYTAISNLKPKNTLIVVHTEHLQIQHMKNLVKYDICKGEDIGLVGAGSKQLNKKIVVAIVNSIRYDVLKDMKFELLILDEFHHYPPEVNRTFIEAGQFEKVMGLSATPERTDDLHIPFLKKYPIVYSYEQHKAIEDKVLSEYKVVNVGIVLLPFEQQIYDKIDERLLQYYPITDFLSLPWQAKKLINKRKQLILNSPKRITTTVKLVKWEVQNNVETPKMIIFNEYIESAEVIKDKLSFEGIKSEVYHSGLRMEERKEIISRFKVGSNKILVAVKALDEGINVPDAEVAIIVSGTSSKRQYIQRVGRVLRKKDNKPARVYQIYMKKTKDEDWIKNRMRGVKNLDVKWI